MKYVLFALIAVVAVFVIIALVCVIRAVKVKKAPSDKKPAINWTKEEEDKYAVKLSEMVKISTVSKKKGEEYGDFLKLQEVMARLYPNIFSKLEKHDFEGNILRVWRGTNPSKGAILLMGHQDVVPAAEKEWTRDPFSGEIADGCVHGRGSMDCKSTLSAEWSAVEELIEEGFVPEEDIWLFSSVNEENSGGGAIDAAKWFKEQGIRLNSVLDEGGAVIGNVFPGLSQPCAAIGIVEKGFCNLKFVARGKGGHSSTPPKNTPMARLGMFMAEVEKTDPFKRELVSPIPEMFTSIAGHLTFPLRLVMSNLWLFKGLLAKVLPLFSPMAGAFVRTTCAFTMAQGSEAPNVIPDEAYVICNIRPSVHQKAEESIEVLKNIAKKYDIETEVLLSRDPSNVSSPESDEFNYLTKCITEAIPDVVPIPYLMTGGTDCRQFELVSDNCLRFTPTRLTPEQLAAMHAANESIGVSALAEGVKFYKYYIQNRK
ncbi:MAG: M20/M25/M40 family metallo-hydrolase [Ruminococcaceae bacterium]|nr:M20/M25/M40 family metallo-hydrolase [Oscillospiraceae bacterium]MBR3597484.1 M20/M25/M40 family metallo-hydrolase [Clostridia bacterium]